MIIIIFAAKKKFRPPNMLAVAGYYSTSHLTARATTPIKSLAQAPLTSAATPPRPQQRARPRPPQQQWLLPPWLLLQRARPRPPQQQLLQALRRLDTIAGGCWRALVTTMSSASGIQLQRCVCRATATSAALIPLRRCQGQWHALIDCYGRHRRPVARSNCLLWPTPQASGTL